MLATSPITRQSVGHTFTVALVVLGLGVVSQLGAVGWAFVARNHAEPPQLGDKPSYAKVGPTPLRMEVGEDIFGETPEQPPQTLTTEPDSGVPPKPTPVPTNLQKPPEAVPQTRFDELIQQGRQLRENQNAGNALTKFREASAMDPRNPVAIAELAATYDKMGLTDRGAEQWKRIYDMGSSAAGIYFTAAEAKLRETQVRAVLSAMPQAGTATTNSAGPDLSSSVDGIAPGALIGLGKITMEEQVDSDSLKRFTLRIPVKARPRAKIEVRDLVIHVLFYDKVDGRNVVQTSANVSSKWATSPTDWADSETEELAVDYQLPRPESARARRETREYFGYLVRVYYKQQLQATVSDPERLGEQYPAPATPNDR
jgi:hypothetical protein